MPKTETARGSVINASSRAAAIKTATLEAQAAMGREGWKAKGQVRIVSIGEASKGSWYADVEQTCVKK